MAARGKHSAGLLMYRIRDGALQVFLVHPGGPFWANKDTGAWTLPKGEIDAPDEPLLDAARREFAEETGITPEGPYSPLTPLRQKSGKVVHAWSFQGDADPESIRSNTFELEWPPRSGRRQTFAEVDRAAFFALPEARVKILPGQLPFLDELAQRLGAGGTTG